MIRRTGIIAAGSILVGFSLHSPASPPRRGSAMQHGIVANMPERFAGWPANNGVWVWGNEILVGFSDGAFVEQRGHNIEGKSDDTPSVKSLLARSYDGGKTWKVEYPTGYVTFRAHTRPIEQPVPFQSAGFAMRIIGIGYHGVQNPEGGFYTSTDKGKTWQGAFSFGALMQDPHLTEMEFTARTSYLVTGEHSCLLFASARPQKHGGGRDKTFCTETTDGGKTFRFLSWIVPFSEPNRAVMPTVVRLADGSLVALLRRRNPNDKAIPCWIDCYLSSDEARTWRFASRVGETGKENGNPPALVALKDGRLCCVYGNRTTAKMLMRVSADQGATWGEEQTLRDDFKPDAYHDNDFGYPRLVQTRDGSLVAMYYWATQENPHQHIAFTRWKP